MFFSHRPKIKNVREFRASGIQNEKIDSVKHALEMKMIIHFIQLGAKVDVVH